MLKKGDLVSASDKYACVYSSWSSTESCEFIEDIFEKDVCLVISSRRWVFDELTDCPASRGIKIITPRGKIGYTYIDHLKKIRCS